MNPTPIPDLSYDSLPPGIRIINPDGPAELIMVVDDDDGVRMLAEYMLAHDGYRVVSAETGEKAVELIAKLRDRVDLVLLDFLLPGLNCAQTLSGLRNVVPNLPVIIVSGYTSNENLEKLVDESHSRFIPKPVTRKKLSVGISTALEAVSHRHGNNGCHYRHFTRVIPASLALETP